MNATMIGLAVVVLGTGAFVMVSVVPLFARLRKLTEEAERLLYHLNGDLPPLIQQTTHALENLAC